MSGERARRRRRQSRSQQLAQADVRPRLKSHFFVSGGNVYTTRFRRGPAGLIQRILWVPDPENQCVWAERTISVMVVVGLVTPWLLVISTTALKHIEHRSDYPLGPYPFWWPWLQLAICTAAVVGGGRRMWRASMGRAAGPVVVLLIFLWDAVDGYTIVFGAAVYFVLLAFLSQFQKRRDRSSDGAI